MERQLQPVIRAADENRVRFEAFCRSLSPEDLVRPVPDSTWQVQDFVAHLATIDDFVGDWFAHLADGRPWRPRGDDGSPFNIDTWNEARVQPRRAVGVEALLAAAASERKRFWSVADRLTPEILAQEFEFRGNTVTYLRYLELWTGHDPAHAADMLRALPPSAHHGARAWVDDWAATARELRQLPA